MTYVDERFKMSLLGAAESLRPELTERIGGGSREIVLATLTSRLHPDARIAHGAARQCSALLGTARDRPKLRDIQTYVERHHDQDFATSLDVLTAMCPRAAPWLASLGLIHDQFCAAREQFMTGRTGGDDTVEAIFTLAVTTLRHELAPLAAVYPFAH